MDKSKTYSELCKLKTFKERFEYLKLGDKIGQETFGAERYLNQIFYHSPEWKRIRREVILRDNGNEFGLDGYPIYGKTFIHHMNPISKEDILERLDEIMVPEYLVCVSFDVHNAIHYGIEPINPDPVERREGDTKLW